MIVTETKALIDEMEAKQKIAKMIPGYKIYANGYTRKEVQKKYLEGKVIEIRKDKNLSDKQKDEKI